MDVLYLMGAVVLSMITISGKIYDIKLSNIKFCENFENNFNTFPVFGNWLKYCIEDLCLLDKFQETKSIRSDYHFYRILLTLRHIIGH